MSDPQPDLIDIMRLAERLEDDVDIVFHNKHLLEMYLIMIDQQDINVKLTTAIGQLIAHQPDLARQTFEGAADSNVLIRNRVSKFVKNLLKENQPESPDVG